MELHNLPYELQLEILKRVSLSNLAKSTLGNLTSCAVCRRCKISRCIHISPHELASVRVLRSVCSLWNILLHKYILDTYEEGWAKIGFIVPIAYMKFHGYLELTAITINADECNGTELGKNKH